VTLIGMAVIFLGRARPHKASIRLQFDHLTFAFAENFNPKHKSVHAIKYAVAVVAFMAQLGKLPGTMSLPFR